MKKSKLTKYLSCATSFVLLATCLTGCGDKKGNNVSEREPEKVEQLMSTAYSTEEIQVPEGISNISSIIYQESENSYFMNCYTTDWQPIVYKANSDFSDFTAIDISEAIPADAENSVRSISLNSAGGITVFNSHTTYGDLPIPDYNNVDFDWESFDWEVYEEARETVFIANVYDADNNFIEAINFESTNEEESYIMSTIATESGFVSIMDTGLSKYNADGSFDEKIEVKDVQYINNAAYLGENNILVSGWGTDKNFILTIDITTGETVQSYEPEASNAYYGNIYSGNDKYDFFVKEGASLSGYNKETQVLEEVVNWTNSDINGDTVENCIITSDNQIYITINDYYSVPSQVQFLRLIPRDASEFENKQLIKVGMMYSDYEVNDMVSKFNKESDSYRITVTEYSKYDTEENEYQGARQKLNEELMTGNAPDVIFANTYSLDYSSLQNKGVFADLYEFIDNDSELSRDSFIEAALKMGEYNGKLAYFSKTFSLNMLVGKTEYIGENSNMTISDVINAYESRANKDMKFMTYSSKSQIAGELIYNNLNYYIGYNPEKRTTNFNKEDLIKALEFANTFEDDIDWENVPDDYWDNISKEERTDMINDTAMFKSLYVRDFRSYHEAIAGVFANKDITFLNRLGEDKYTIFPNYSAVSIVSNSGVKEGAWEFIRSLFTENSEDNTYSYEFNTNKNMFLASAEIAKKPYSYTDPDTSEVYEYPSTYWIGDSEIEIGEITDEEIADLTEIINNSSIAYSNPNVSTIFYDEIEKYLAGDQTVQQAVDMIESKVSIYISEQS